MPIPNFLGASLLVAAGGALGSWLRFVVGLGWSALLGPARAGAFPISTLTVNVLGSLAMGVIAGLFARHGSHGESARLFLMVGVMGGFTTFSSFSLDVISLAQRGQPGLGMFYAGLSVLTGIVALVAGLSVARAI
ncbi:fluoride efflux transporter FluC [Novosphingobium sp. 9]|uniref:fluoride efflux transporter FluC n=1 Tax=Novosphingobium sp. 9 TaxID=2025349 RepID=UPI0021B61ABF|nr:CrcB family protein [Novosphingobium sp. 9]